MVIMIETCKIESAVLEINRKMIITYLLSNGNRCSIISKRRLLNYKDETLTCYYSLESNKCSDLPNEILQMQVTSKIMVVLSFFITLFILVRIFSKKQQ